MTKRIAGEQGDDGIFDPMSCPVRRRGETATGVEPALSDYDVTLIYTTGETVFRGRALALAVPPMRSHYGSALAAEVNALISLARLPQALKRKSEIIFLIGTTKVDALP
jgi:hypothetical protein